MVIFSENLPWNTINFLDTLWYFIPLIHPHYPPFLPAQNTPPHPQILPITHNWLKHFIPTQSININTVAFKRSFINWSFHPNTYISNAIGYFIGALFNYVWNTKNLSNIETLNVITKYDVLWSSVETF